MPTRGARLQAAMEPLACLMHWYISMMYVVPVGVVGGWGWWSSKRMDGAKNRRARRGRRQRTALLTSLFLRKP